MATKHTFFQLLARVLLVVAVMTATACGGGGDESAEDPAPSDEGDAAPDPEPTPEPAAQSSSTTSTTTTTTTTTMPEPEPLPVFNPEDLPDLIARWEAAGTDPTAEPLALAEDLIGFPVPVAVPEGSTMFRVDLRLNAANPDDDWFWEWSYQAHAPGPVPEIDIDLEGMGPGAVGLRAEYDDILGRLGWTYSNSTGSDPSSGEGGPQSVNHVYQNDLGIFPIGGTDATPGPLFVWLDEDLVFGDPELPGYRIDVDASAPTGFIPVPLIAALVESLSISPSSRLAALHLTSWERDADSFDAEEGLRYLTADITILEEGLQIEEVQALYASQLGDSTFRAADESFFDPGFWEPTEPTSFGEVWQLAILLLDRYPGQVQIAEDGGRIILTVSVTLEANRELLSPLES